MITTTVNPRWQNESYTCHIEPGKSIRLTGFNRNYRKDGFSFDITFKIGDPAEYDSYNLIYIGHIVSIGPKTVTIKPRRETRTRRLDLATFAARNFNFDLARIERENAIELQCI